MWVMWAQRTGRPGGVEFHHFGASREHVVRTHGGAAVPVRVAQADDGVYVGWVDGPSMPDFVIDYRDDDMCREDERHVRLSAELLEADLGDTSNCADGECEICGRVDNLAVGLHETPVGLHCLTTCEEHSGAAPRLSWPEAVDLALRHCQHIGLGADEMAALLEAERAERGEAQS